MTKLLVSIASFAFLAACGGSKTPPADPPSEMPPPTDNEAPQPATLSPDECTAKGGRVKGDIGDGKVACDPGEKEIGRVSQGIEGAICCTAGDPAAP